MKRRQLSIFLTLSLPVIFGSASLMVNCPGILDLNNPFNYADQAIPAYVLKDNTPGNNPVTDAGATLGRVLFYDKNLSVDNTVSCSSCHLQEFAFGDTAVVSSGVNGVTGRHSMRLVNAKFADENRFFWDERANSLEIQTTQPIQDHFEMGFSGQNGDPNLDSLIEKLGAIDYYQTLFAHAFGSANITEQRLRRALAQFVRSIQSFDSKFDAGLALTGNIGAPFPNFTSAENLGKTLFTTNPPNGGANCIACHRAPEFDIAPNSNNNNVIGVAGSPTAIDITNERSPSLRNLVNPSSGGPNGPMMHDGSMGSLMEVIEHYNLIVLNPANTNLDNRLRNGAGQGQNLQLSQAEKEALVDFLETLTGSDIYSNEKWSDPFDADGNLTVVPVLTASTEVLLETSGITLFEDPSINDLRVEYSSGNYQMNIKDEMGNIYQTLNLTDDVIFDVCTLPADLYFVEFLNLDENTVSLEKILRE